MNFENGETDMKCIKCGAELSNDTKFCSYCGTKVKEATDNNVSKVVEPLKGINNNGTFADKLKTLWKNMDLFCKIVTIITICFMLLFLKAFSAGKVAASIIALASAILAIIALLIKMKIIKTSQKWIHITALILSLLIILPYSNVYKFNRNNSELDISAIIDANVSDSKPVQSTKSDSSITENEISRTSASDYASKITTENNTTTAKDAETTSDIEQLKIIVKNSSSAYYGMNYLKVKKAFKKMGFSNIKLMEVTTEDPEYTDGEVFSVNINGFSFNSGDTFEPDDKISIKYYQVEVPLNENITIKNNSEFAAVLTAKNEFDPIIEQFANKYAGQTIEFDGYTANVAHSGNYKTRFDYLIYVGDYDSSQIVGPQFQIKDVNYYELHLTGNNVPNALGEGLNIHIVAEVGTYNINTGLFQIDPIRITMR